MCSELASLLLFILCAKRVTIIQEEQRQDRSLVPGEDTCSLLFFPTSFQHFPLSSGWGLSLELSLPKHLVKPRYVPKFHVEISVRIILCVLPLCPFANQTKADSQSHGEKTYLLAVSNFPLRRNGKYYQQTEEEVTVWLH